jgi:hypothetical protein
MRCKECGEGARDETLRYCENCGAKMPPPPPPGTIRRTSTGVGALTTGRARSTAAAVRDIPARDEAEDTDPGLHALPKAPPYDGPVWLEHVPGHSPSVAGVGLLAVALVLSIFGGVGSFWSLVVVMGGWWVTAREMREAGQRHALVDWVPDTLVHPAVPALFTVVVAALALRMLGVGLTSMLWLAAAALLAYDQYRKVYAGPKGWSRLFEPRALLRGTAPMALGGVALCLLALFLTWVPTGTTRSAGPVPLAPPELHVVDAPTPSEDFIYGLIAESYDKGWDQSFSVTLELLLLGVLALMALRPEVPRPDWLRFAPIGVVLLGLVWTLVNGGLLLGPVLFLAGLAATGFAAVYGAFNREA